MVVEEVLRSRLEVPVACRGRIAEPRATLRAPCFGSQTLAPAAAASRSRSPTTRLAFSRRNRRLDRDAGRRQQQRRRGMVSPIEWSFHDLLSGRVEGDFDIIAANPPYVRDSTSPGCRRERASRAGRRAVRWPGRAPAPRGVLDTAVQKLRPHGWLIMEIGLGQEDDVIALASRRPRCGLTTRAAIYRASRARSCFNARFIDVSDCLFCRIVAGSIPANIVHRDDSVVAFRDIDPKAPLHVLIVPTKHIATLERPHRRGRRARRARCSGAPRPSRANMAMPSVGIEPCSTATAKRVKRSFTCTCICSPAADWPGRPGRRSQSVNRGRTQSPAMYDAAEP